MRGLMWISVLGLAAVGTIPASAAVAAQQQGGSAQAMADELLAADRAFAAAAADLDTATAISAMFHDDVIMPLPTGTFARGRAAATEALRANPFNTASRAEWAPVRAGVSADGQQGFTFGFMTLRGNDGSTRLAKYLGYWVRTPQGWRLAAYKRAVRPEGDVSTDLLAPSLPAAIVAPTADSAIVETHRQSLRAAEQAFSDEAQRIGLGSAFQRYGREDAMNMGPGAGFTLGAQAIGGVVTADPSSTSSPVSWNADEALVASSGDLGVTFGLIRPNGPPPEGRPPASAFFTIWRRDLPDGRWLYIAE